MGPEAIENILDVLIDVPIDGHIDASIVEALKTVRTSPPEVRKAMMKAILDDCAHSARASDFAMTAMDILWRNM